MSTNKNQNNKIVIAVLDVSSSMGWEASQNPTNTEATGFTRLDLVKHSMKTLIEIFDGSLAVVAFSTNAKTIRPLTSVRTPKSKKDMQNSIEKLSAGGSTDIWAGIEVALEMRKKSELGSNQQVHVVLLTDGEPTYPTVFQKYEEYLQKSVDNEHLNTVLHCFGFGYKLDTNLLHRLCQRGNGVFGYIPDHTMVGTIFINAISNIMTDMKGKRESGHDQPIQLVVESLKSILGSDNSNSLPIIQETMKKLKEMATGQAKEVDSQFVADLLIDLDDPDPHKGQISKAVSKKDNVYHKWGKNHLVSYLRGLELRLCVNFKDQALQHFVTDEFQNYQDQGNLAFADLPAPKPSGSRANERTAPVQMARLNNRYGGCFTGQGLVLMNDGNQKKVHELKKGDKVFGGASIVCVVRTSFGKEQEIQMATNGQSLELTLWHPIRSDESNSQWIFPNSLSSSFQTKKLRVSQYFNLVLDSLHFVKIDEVDVCTLGHGFTENQVIKHDFFGTDKVIGCLQKKSGWEKGEVVLDGQVQLGPDGLVCEF